MRINIILDLTKHETVDVLSLMMKEGIVKDAFVGESIRVLNEKIDEWELPVRLRNICKNNGIIYSYDLTKLTASQFLKLHHCGKQALIQMINIMLIKGIKFKE